MKNTGSPIMGGCLCKAIRYEIRADAIGVRACWCRLCQYLATGNASVNAVFPSDAIKISGETRDYLSVADSGNNMHREFCPNCGTHLFSTAEARPHLIVVRVGSLDNPEAAAPQMTVWRAMAPSWACINDSLPSLDGQPPPMA